MAIAETTGAHTQILTHIPVEEVIRDVGKTINIILEGTIILRIMLTYSDKILLLEFN